MPFTRGSCSCSLRRPGTRREDWPRVPSAVRPANPASTPFEAAQAAAPLATGPFPVKLWLKSCHRPVPSAHDADTCDEILGVSADDACGAPTGSAARASITAQSVQPTGRSVRRAKLPAARVVADAVSAKATAGYMRAASEISDRVWTPGEIARLAD